MDDELQTGGTKQTHLKWFGIPRLIPFLRPHRRLFFLLFAFGLAASATEILFPLFQRYAIDHYIAKGTLDTLPVFILLYVLVLAVAAVSGYLSAYGSCALELRVADIQVTADDVAQVVELWTGIPAVKIKETEYGRLMGLEDALKEHIIGQDEAVHSVALAVKRARADLSGRHRPASFIFVGPTGVGKTELVKQLANQLFDTVDPLISIDMSEYMEKYAVSRLIGSPPGYVGYDEAGQLTEKVRRHPYSVVLFDEIEKAHPDVMNILLQILDEGKINDAQGRTVDFSNTVICMTSNAGSSDRTALTGFGRTEEQVSREKSMKALQEFLRPEFLGRVDEVITFRPLEQADLEKIAALMLDEYKPGLEARGLKLEYTPQALAAIVNETSTRFGARELRKTIRKTLEDPVAEAIVAGRLTGGQTVTLAADADGKPQLVLPE